MDEPYQEKHGAFLLKCVPARDGEGRFLPSLIAIRLDRSGHETEVIELIAAPHFADASAAAEYALNVGKRWVRERMLPRMSDTGH